MSQSKRHSLLESVLNVFSGMVIAFGISFLAHHYEVVIQTYVWAGFKWDIGVGSNIIMTIVFTVVSVLRSYAWRRHFNRRETKVIYNGRE